MTWGKCLLLGVFKGIRNVIWFVPRNRKDISHSDSYSIWGCKVSDFAFLKDSGILMMWGKDVLKLISSSGGESLICVFLSIDSSLSWEFISLYGPHSREDKVKFLGGVMQY